MKIPDLGGHGGPQRTDGPGNAGDRREVAPTRNVERDSVELSPTARRRLALLESAKSLPEVRDARVTELREAIDSGRYEVDARRLARAILEFEDGLNG